MNLDVITYDFLYENYTIGCKTTKEIADLVGCHCSTIKRRLHKFGLNKTREEVTPFPNNVLTKAFLKEEYVVKEKAAKTIADEVGCSVTAVWKRLKKHGFGRTYEEANAILSRKKYNFSLLEEDSPFSVYFNGFFTADGYLHDNDNTFKYALTFGVGLKSLPVLRYFQKYIGGKIRSYVSKEGHPQRVLSYGSKWLVKYYIRKYNIITPKTGKEVFIDYSDELMPYFFRGFLDGDGCVFGYGIIKGFSFVSANKEFLVKMKKYIKDNIVDINNRVCKCTNANAYVLKIYGKNAKKLGDYIYKDVLENSKETFYLPYKYKRFKKYFYDSWDVRFINFIKKKFKI